MKHALFALRFTILYALVLLIWTTQIPAKAFAAPPSKPHRVLALYWYGRDFPQNVDFDSGLQSVLQNSGVEYYSEYFDPNHFPREARAIVLRDRLKKKYSDRTMDVVIATSTFSADFLIKYR